MAVLPPLTQFQIVLCPGSIYRFTVTLRRFISLLSYTEKHSSSGYQCSAVFWKINHEISNFCSRFRPQDLRYGCSTQQWADSCQALLQDQNLFKICDMINFICAHFSWIFHKFANVSLLLCTKFENRLKKTGVVLSKLVEMVCK